MGFFYLDKMRKPTKAFSELSVEQQTELIDGVFQHYRKTGFPFVKSDKFSVLKEYHTFMKYDDTNVIQNDVIGQVILGLSMCWAYMPHHWSISCNGKKTPMDIFNDDVLLKSFIKKLFKMRPVICDSSFRSFIKLFSGVQCVSNFRPVAASALYKYFLPQGGTVYDMSSGFGGRLFGAIKAGVSYVGTDPSKRTYDGLLHIVKDFGGNLPITIFNKGSEELELPAESIDFAFTSPPYFNCESYSADVGQSCVRYTTQESWRISFLQETFVRVFSALKPGSFMAINIANVPSYKNLENHTVETAEHCGFSLVKVMKLALSNPKLRQNKSNWDYKYEPVFIFKKPGNVLYDIGSTNIKKPKFSGFFDLKGGTV